MSAHLAIIILMGQFAIRIIVCVNAFLDPQTYDGRNSPQSNYQPYNGNSNQNNFNPSAPPDPQNRQLSSKSYYFILI